MPYWLFENGNVETWLVQVLTWNCGLGLGVNSVTKDLVNLLSLPGTLPMGITAPQSLPSHYALGAADH